jgi:hypothetical protein
MDDKTKVGKQDRDRVAGGEPYEVEYFANKHGISMDQARRLIQALGNDRIMLDAAAEKLKRKAS